MSSQAAPQARSASGTSKGVISASSVAAAAGRSSIALVHHPVYDRSRNLVTTAITNLDIHDIARSSHTFGLAGYYLVTPIAAQRELAERILGHWRLPSAEGPQNQFRREALAAAEVCASVADAAAAVARRTGVAPLIVATSARPSSRPIGYRSLLASVAAGTRPLLLLLGTGWGLADELLDRVDHVLAPIRGHGIYNHLSVRSAAAIVLDRLFGVRDESDAGNVFEGSPES